MLVIIIDWDPHAQLHHRAWVVTMADLMLRFLCGLRGYHIYWSVWNPKPHEVPDAQQESNNPYNQYVIAAWKHASAANPDKAVGHIPIEISRLTTNP